MSAEPLLVAKGLRKDYGDLLALAGLDLSVKAGEKVALLGHNGSGKTTFLRMAAGLLEPTDGELTIDGAAPGSIDARVATSYLADTPVLYEDLNVWEHLEFVARLHGIGDWEGHAEFLLDRLGLTNRAEDLPVTFSRGLKQKTSIALAFVRPFDVLLVDEPFVGLDLAGQAAILELLDEAAADDAAVLVATHQMDFVHRAGRSVVLRDGELIHDGPVHADEVAALVEG